jgi:hypothetical protein
MASRNICQAALTCSKTKIPPKTTARAFAPFLTKMPAQMPHTVPNVSSYMLTEDSGGGGRGARSGFPNAAVDWGCEEVVAPAFPVLSQGSTFITRIRRRLTLAVQFPEVCLEPKSKTCTGKASTHNSCHSTGCCMVTQVPGAKRGWK